MPKRQIVGVVSQKGGVGKSTLCQLIAREAALDGRQSKIIDLDVKQLTSTEWVRTRSARGLKPSIDVEPTRDLTKALKQSRGFDIVLLDGAAGSPKRTAELVPACDLIVIPTGASRADLLPGLALARRLRAVNGGKAVPVFVLCRIISPTEAAEARAAIEAAGFEMIGDSLTERASYRQAQDAGRSLSETGFATLNNKAKQLARGVLDRLGWDPA